MQKFAQKYAPAQDKTFNIFRILNVETDERKICRVDISFRKLFVRDVLKAAIPD
ncbi:MAG: hypothetical protein IJR85_10865 [Synergistaceae bacterium]|nr:hypothetical protein [Synergistaceae bacterium]